MVIEMLVALVSFLGLVLSWVALPGGARAVVREGAVELRAAAETA